eukprot:Hpha_TRINITY_DN5022_c0_g1::TRINITY_DN5022_c0_g1_i1::g.94170::m.94170
MSVGTTLLHADAVVPAARGEVMPPITVSTTYTQEGEDSGYVYARASDSHHVRRRAEAIIGKLEGGNCVLYSSGQAATSAAVFLLAPRRIALRGGYHGTHQVVDILNRVAKTQGGSVESIDIDSELRAGDVLWLESPQNPTVDVYDIEAYSKRAHAVGAVVVVDCTFAPAPLQRALDWGADIVMHSATKFLAGHSDATIGALITRDDKMYKQLQDDRMNFGNTPGNLEVWLLLRSLRTLEVRLDRQCQTAAALARWLEGRGRDLGVSRVFHPSLPSFPSHEVARKQMPGGFGGVLAFHVEGTGAAKALPTHLRLVKNATSLGGVESLIEWRRKWDDKISPKLLRLSVGLEKCGDLCADLEQALLKVRHGSGDSRL